MPPKLINLGKKVGEKVELPIKKENDFIANLSKNIENILGKTDILEESKLQNTITPLEKNEYLGRARKQEEKLPKLVIEGVNFNILNSKVLDNIAVVNVSTKISRTDDVAELIQKTTQMANKKDRRCYETDDGFTFAGAARLLPNQSVSSYTEMGTVDNDKLCTTCFRTNIDCPGHLGEIKLHTAFPHPLFREYLLWVLTSVCNSCSTLLLPESYIKRYGIDKLQGKNRLKRIYEIVEKISGKTGNPCPNQKIRKCTTNPRYKHKKHKDYDNYQIEYRYANGSKEFIHKDINDIKKILNNISKEDAKLMGFSNGSHPTDMILESFTVIPPCARPYTIREGEIKEDHLTTAYDEIIRDNQKYSIVADENRKRNIEKDLYFHISHLIDNSDGKYCRSPTEKIQGIKQRITKKEGLIRCNIMGKRVNFCGRSVLGPDSSLKFGEIAIPAAMAEKLTVPEVVHERNLDYARELWDKKQISHFQYTVNGERHRVFDKTYEIRTLNGQKLRPMVGFVIERYIRDGDVVLVNRQPTLYKYSMVGNFIKIVPKKTIGLHMTETVMRQADFDGDEANIHVIQSLDARFEAATFANVQACVPDALKNSAMIGQMQNSVSSAYMLTRDNAKNIDEITQKYLNKEITVQEYEMSKEVILTEDEMTEGLNTLTYREDLESLPARLKKHKINPLCGKALFSALLPKDFYYSRTNSSDNKVLIKDGVLISGVITKDNIGKAGITIHMSIWKWYGQERAVKFITDCTYLTDWFIYQHGLTIGFSDVKLSNEVMKNIDSIILKNLNETKAQITSLPKISKEMSVIEKNFREQQVLTFLSEFKAKIDKIGNDALSPQNPLNIMANSGAKGSGGNTSNIVGLKGQEMVFGERPIPKLSDNTRCLPYFDFNSEDIKARGFISNSFVKGLTPSEMYFLSEGGRVGLINTAVNTAESGSLSHKLVKVLEDCKVSYDGSIRNAANAIYQLSYLDGYEVGESVESFSPSTGRIISFINIREAVERINAEFA